MIDKVPFLVGLSLSSALFVPVLALAAPGGQKPDAGTLASVPLELTRRGAVVQAKVNGMGPLGFIFDCGSET